MEFTGSDRAGREDIRGLVFTAAMLGLSSALVFFRHEHRIFAVIFGVVAAQSALLALLRVKSGSARAAAIRALGATLMSVLCLLLRDWWPSSLLRVVVWVFCLVPIPAWALAWWTARKIPQ